MNDTNHKTKQNASHAPWPWAINGYNLAQVIKVQDGPDRRGRAYVDGRHQEVIADVGRDNEMTWGERYANARLIAASPKLLAFAEAIRNACAVQANLCSTASEEERTRFIHSIYALWNDHGVIAVDEAKGLAV